MSENISFIPSRLKNAAVGGHVAGALDIIDDNKGKTQDVINQEADAKFSQIDDEIEAYDKQDVVPVDSLPSYSTADPKKIYRVVGETSYTDYMVNASGDGWKKLSESTFPGIDALPTAGSHSLAESGGIDKAISGRSIAAPYFKMIGFGGDNKNSIDFQLVAGKVYRFTLSKTIWDCETATGGIAVFYIGHFVGANYTPDCAVYKPNAAEAYYEIEAIEADYYQIGLRADTGEELNIIVDLPYDSKPTYQGKKLIPSGAVYAETIKSINSDYVFLNYGSDKIEEVDYLTGFRLLYAYNQAVNVPVTVNVPVDWSQAEIQVQVVGVSSYQDALNPNASPIEYTQYDDVLKGAILSNPNTHYIRLAFKTTSSLSNNLTESQIAFIRKNLEMYVSDTKKTFSELSDLPHIILKDSFGNFVSPASCSEDVVCKDNKKLTDVLDELELFTKASVNELSLGNMKTEGILSGAGYTRLRYTVKVQNAPCVAQIRNTPSGYSFLLQSNYSYTDAQSLYVSDVEHTNWGELVKKFTDTNAVFISINIKKSDDSLLTDADVEILEASGIKLDISCGEDTLDEEGIIALNDRNRTLQYMKNAKRVENVWLEPQTPPLTLLHFSDIHADEDNLSRILVFMSNFSSYIDDAIHTGDIVENTFDNSFAFWANAGADKILQCTGNHDYYYEGDYEHVTSKQVYDKFFADYVDGWNVFQPENAASLGLNYYYKDYATNKVRLIVVDNMRVDEDQEQWVESVLADALTNGLHVICAAHMGSLEDNEYINEFNSLQPIPDYSQVAGWMYTALNNIYDSIDSFIGDGGNFIGWINGHFHYDKLGVIKNHPNQLSIHVAVANHGVAPEMGQAFADVLIAWGDMDREEGAKSQDCFNVYSIDTYRSRIKIHRIGADVDRDLRYKGNLCYDYKNHQIIYSD